MRAWPALVRALALAATAAIADPSRATASGDAVQDGVPDAIRAAMALVVCDDGAQRTYRTGIVVGSNGFESYVLGQSGLGCHAPSVILAADPSYRYPAQVMSSASSALIAIANLVLAIDRPAAPVAPLDQRPFAKGDAELLVGYPISAVDAGPPAGLTSASGTVTYVSSRTNDLLGSDGGFIDSAATMASAVVVDPETKTVVGFADAYKPELIFGKPPTTEYAYKTAAAIAGLLQTRGVQAGVQRLTGDALTGERVAASLRRQAFPIFRAGSASAGAIAGASGTAIVLGATPSATLYAALDAGREGAYAIAVRDRTGAVHMTTATVVAVDTTTQVSYLQGAPAGVAVPAFAAAPALGGAVALASAAPGGRCAWASPAPGPDGCRVQVRFGRMSGPMSNPPHDGAFISGLVVIGDTSSVGWPVVVPDTLAIAGLADIYGLIPISAILAKAATLQGWGSLSARAIVSGPAAL